jgi:hypothetical protein
MKEMGVLQDYRRLRISLALLPTLGFEKSMAESGDNW